MTGHYTIPNNVLYGMSEVRWNEWMQTTLCRCPDVRHGYQGCSMSRRENGRVIGLHPVCDDCAAGEH